jgi:lysophospholipase L1-like esterase
MNPKNPRVLRGVRLAAAFVLSSFVLFPIPALVGQPAAAPPPAPGSVAPAVSTGALTGFSVPQQAIAAGLMIGVNDLVAAVATARTALAAASLAYPADPAALLARVEAVAAAELALANARVAAMARIQSTANRFNPEQLQALAQQAGRGGRGGGVIPRHTGFAADKTAVLAQGGPQLLLLGDSITDFWRRPDSLAILQKHLGQYRPYNIGISGIRTVDVRLQVELGLIDGISPKVTMIMIGTNDLAARGTVEGTAASIKDLVADVRAKLPDTKILLLGIFPRGNLATDPYREQIRQVNALIAKLDDGRQVKYFDFGDKFLTPDGTLPPEIMPDYLHPNAAGYQIWADAVTPVIGELAR